MFGSAKVGEKPSLACLRLGIATPKLHLIGLVDPARREGARRVECARNKSQPQNHRTGHRDAGMQNGKPVVVVCTLAPPSSSAVTTSLVTVFTTSGPVPNM